MVDISCSNKETGLYKIARFKLSNPQAINFKNKGLVKEASSKNSDGDSKIDKFLKAEMEKHPTALFFKAKAIEADIPNNNGDCFSEEELKKACQSFVGVPFFTNHQNGDIEKAKGKIVFAEWNPEDKAIYVISFVDREAYPHLCRGIEEGYVQGVSMGSCGINSFITMSDLSVKKISKIKTGDKVLSAFGNVCEVEKIFSANLGQPMYRMKLIGYDKAPLLSFDHPVYAIQGSSDPSFVEVKDIKEGDFVLISFFDGCGFKESKNRVLVKDKNGKEFLSCKVKSVKKVDYDDLSYDLKVKDDESYIADGVAVHNCSVEYSECSICSNEAASQESYCTHIKNMKGRKFSGQVQDVKTGEIKTLKDAQVYEKNYGIRFIELSGVVDPACSSCKIKDVYKSEDFLKAASCYNGLSMFKTSEFFEKNASQQDVESLNQALQILQDVSIKLIQNRKNIEMEFSADIVKILADLQEYVDGLVQAGFGKLPDNQGGAPGNAAEGQPAPAEGQAIPGLGEPQAGGQAPGAQPIAGEELLGGAGSVSGQDNAPLVNPPSPPADLSGFKNTTRPTAQRSTKLNLPNKPGKISENGENVNMRRIPGEVEDQKRKISKVLQNDWQEKLEKISNRLKDSLLTDVASNGENNSSGGTIMSNKIMQEAKAKEVQNLVTEKQLDEGLRLHPRKGEPKQDTEGKQLAEQHEGDPNVIEEKLLEDARTGETPDEVEEKYLEPTREGEVMRATENAHVEKQRVGKEGNEVTEKQLSHPAVDTPSTRTSSSIKDHVEAAVDIVSRTVVCAQSTPERVVKVAGAFASSTISDQTAVVEKMAKYAGEIPSFDDSRPRSDKEVKDLLVAFASKSVKDKSLNPEYVIKAFAVLKNNSNASTVIEGKVKEIIASGSLGEKNVEDEMASYVTAMDKSAKGMPQGLKDYLDKKNGKESDKKDGDKCEKCGKAECECEKKDTVKAETNVLEKALSKEAKKTSGLIIETSFKEMGVSEAVKDDDKEIARIADGFARGACAHMGIKVAAVVNVTVDGESGDVVIAVDTENGSVEIPVGGEELSSEDKEETAEPIDLETEIPEETSEMGAPPAAPEAGAAAGVGAPDQFGATTPPAGGAPQGLGAFTSTKKNVKTAQFGGGSQAPGAADPSGMNKPADPTGDLGMAPGPGEDAGLGSFTDDTPGEEEAGIPGDEEQKEAGTVCPICGSTDTETGRKDQGPGQFDCNSCGVKYTYTVNVEVLNPKELLGEGSDFEKEIEAPETPSMPVAAEISLDRDILKKISKVHKDVGDICPACGSIEVEAEGEPSNLKVACKKCKTQSEKSVLINVENPVESMMRIAWTLDPKKRKCESCSKVRKAFASDMAFGKLMKRAEKVSIPDNKVLAWLKSNYPKIDYITNGPFKGQLFADTIIEQLKTFGLSKGKYLKALAEAQSKEDPMDTCVKDHKKKGYNLAESQRLCGCLKEKYASEEDENIYIQAFAGMIDKSILRKMASYKTENVVKTAEVKSSLDDDASLDSLPEAPKEVTPTKTELAKSLYDDVSLSLKTAEDINNPPPVVEKKKDETKTKEQTNSEKNVNGDGVEDKDNHMCDCKETKANPSRGAIGGELKEQIPGPKVPRGDATMGKETKAPEEGVKVPSKEKGIDTSALGQSEASNKGEKMKKSAYAEQEPMKSKSNDNPQVDNTSGDTALDEKSVSDKKVQVVESIEEKDNVARGDAVINDENKFDAKGPDVPRGDAKMGNENPPKAQEVSIPSEVSDTQVNMRGRNETEAARNNQLEKVAAARREHAMRFAGQLLERGVIKEAEVEEFVRDLSALSIDRMKSHVALLLKSASVTTHTTVTASSPTLTTAIVKEVEINNVPANEPSLAEKLAGCFTIGGREQDRAIRMRIAEDEKENGSN